MCVANSSKSSISALPLAQILQGRRTLQDKMLQKTSRFNLRRKRRTSSIIERHTDYQLLGSINCKQETARCSSGLDLHHNFEMIDHGLTYYVEFTGSFQCMECGLAIDSLIHRIQRESKAKYFILSYINCYVVKFERRIRLRNIYTLFLAKYFVFGKDMLKIPKFLWF